VSRVESILLGIGEMSRRSGLTVSALRFYDGAGLLVPAYVEPTSGYRRYRDDQVPTARVLANLRRVSMPLPEVARVLDAATPEAAAAVLDRHLRRLEDGLVDARQVLSRVRSILDLREPAMTTSTTVPAHELATALDAVRFAVSADPELPALHGVLVEVGDGAVRLVATDRYRLAVADAGGTVTDPEVSVLVPAAFLDGVRRRLADAREVEVRASSSGLEVVIDGELLASPVLAHDFPAYRGLLPGLREHRVEVDAVRLRADLPDAPGTVHRLVLDGGRPVAGAAGDGDGDRDGDRVVVGVDPAFLLQALSVGDRLVLELDGPVSPLAIRPADGSDSPFSLLMPVRLDA
jgi:DNA-binding transcriptional MerR regulator